MAMDRFDIRLECPGCGKIGIAKAVEEDGWAYMRGNRATKISNLPEGFKAVSQQSKRASVDIYCIDCDVSAVK